MGTKSLIIDRLTCFVLGAALAGIPLTWMLHWAFLKNEAIYNSQQATIQNYDKLAKECVSRVEDETSSSTVLTESQAVVKPIALFNGLLNVAPGPGVGAADRAVPVWLIPMKVTPRVTSAAGANHVYYWINTKTRKLDGPFVPELQPQ